MVGNKRLRFILIIVVVCLLTIFGVAGSLLASQAKPIAEIFLGRQGQGQSAPMFDQQLDGLWYPGKTAKGILRIHNKYPQAVQLEKLSLNVRLQKSEGTELLQIGDVKTLKAYARNMQLTIQKGALLIFDKMIFNQTFYEMLDDNQDPAFQGFTLPKDQRISIGSGKSIDLEYTVQMKEEAGNELQGLLAAVDFQVRVYGSDGNGNNGNDHHNDDDYKDLDHWAHDCIITLLKHGVITGYPDNTIRPNNFITRAEAASIVAHGLGLEPSEDFVNPYSDPLPIWAKEVILSTSEKGIFVGYPPDLFKPAQYITREEMTCILIKAFKDKLDEVNETSEIAFVDKDQISFWAEEFVLKAVQNDILAGYPDQSFKPLNNITRAEAFTIICKLLGYHDEHTAQVYRGD